MVDKQKKPEMGEICHDIAENLIKIYNFKTIPGKKEDEIWIYDKGIYSSIGRYIIKSKVEQKLGRFCKTHYVNEIINKIARKTYIQREKFKCNDLNLICVNNGILNLKTKKLLKHSPMYYFTKKIPIDYIPEAYCHVIFSFLSNVLNESDIECIQEWFGYQLYREYFIKKAIIFRGRPDSGKTTFMNLLSAFVGEDNMSSITLQLIAQGKWHITELYNKYSNICDDLSEKDVADSGTFKQLTGRSVIQGEYKFGEQFQFINYAKLCFACNKIPKINTDIDDYAYWNRWMIFDFDNVFNNENKDTDVHIINKITTPNELSGLLNWAIEGLSRLIKGGKFSYDKSWGKNRKIMQEESSNIAKFSNMCVEQDKDNWILNVDLYEKYREFCMLNDLTNESEQKFGKDLKKYCDFAKFHNQDRFGKWGVKGIKVKSPLPVEGI